MRYLCVTSALQRDVVAVLLLPFQDQSKDGVGNQADDRRHDKHNQELAHSHVLPCDRLAHCKSRRYVSGRYQPLDGPLYVPKTSAAMISGVDGKIPCSCARIPSFAEIDRK